MGLTVANGVALLAAILASSLVASQVQTNSRRYPNQDLDVVEYEYDDGEDTSCLNYCSSRLMGTTYCCPTARPTVDQIVKCPTSNVDCHDLRKPVPTRIDRTYPNGIDCSTYNSGCFGVQRTVLTDQIPLDCTTQNVGCHGVQTVVRTRVQQRYPTIVPAPLPPVTDQSVVYVNQYPVEPRPNYVCRQPYCNPVRTQWPIRRICPGPRCHPQQDPGRNPDITPARTCDREELVTAISLLLYRSYARAYTMQDFIHGLQAIVDKHWEYSWFGQCVAPVPPSTRESIETSEGVDSFAPPTPTATEECYPCPTTTGDIRRCSTRFQTILGTCNSCCHRSRSRVRSLGRSRTVVQRDRQNIREEVSQLLEQARTFTRRDFLTRLEQILIKAEEGRYRWNQAIPTSEPRTPPTHTEELIPVTTPEPSAETEVEGNKSNP